MIYIFYLSYSWLVAQIITKSHPMSHNACLHFNMSIIMGVSLRSFMAQRHDRGGLTSTVVELLIYSEITLRWEEGITFKCFIEGAKHLLVRVFSCKYAFDTLTSSAAASNIRQPRISSPQFCLLVIETKKQNTTKTQSLEQSLWTLFQSPYIVI